MYSAIHLYYYIMTPVCVDSVCVNGLFVYVCKCV